MSVRNRAPAPVLNQTAKGKHLPATGSGARTTNTNAAFTIKATNTSSNQTGTVARATAAWHAAPRVASVGKPVDKQQSVNTTASGWKAKLTTG
ncbi:hypothetical protein [Streptomyces sp. NPDC001340]